MNTLNFMTIVWTSVTSVWLCLWVTTIKVFVLGFLACDIKEEQHDFSRPHQL